MSTSSRNTKALNDLLKVNENRICFDCGAKEPRWCSLAVGVIICIRCAGAHRKYFGNKVKSVDLDNWEDPAQVLIMQQMGNVRALDHYKSNGPPPDNNQSAAAEAWFKSKYNLQKAPQERYPHKPAPSFKEAVQPLSPPPTSVSPRPVQPPQLRPQIVPPTEDNSKARPGPGPLVPTLAAQAIQSEPVLEPSNRNPKKSEIMALYNAPQQPSKPEPPLIPTVVNAKPVRTGPNYDVSVGAPGQWASGPQYYQPVHAVPLYSMQAPQYPYHPGPAVILVQNPNVFAPAINTAPVWHAPQGHNAPPPHPHPAIQKNPNDSSLL